MYFGARGFEESIALGRFVKDRRNQTRVDFPFALARRFEYLVFSIFLLDLEQQKLEVSHTVDDEGRVWDADFLLNQEILKFSRFNRDACAPVYYETTTLHCVATGSPAPSAKPALETDRAVVLSTNLGNNLRLLLAAHVPCGFSQSLFQGIIAYAEDIYGGFQAYAEDLVYGQNRVDLTTAQYWIQHIKSPALVFFGNGYVLTKNTSFDRLLQDQAELKVINGRIVLPQDLSSSLAYQRNLETEHSTAEADIGDTGLRSVLQSAAGHQYYLEQIPSFSHPAQTDDPIRSYFSKQVLIAGPSRTRDADPLKIKAATGVTLQQARIINKIISGKTLRQSAEEIGISYNTARNHIALAQQRLGVSSQMELVNKIISALYVTPDR